MSKINPGGYAKQKDHVWVKPPPGQGRDKVCELCGRKKSQTPDESKCDGKHPDVVRPTTGLEYDPYN